MSEVNQRLGLTPEEERLSLETPAFLSNRFYVTSNPHGTKITFAEGASVGGESQFRSRCAVYLVPSDIKDLQRLLQSIVADMRDVQVEDPDPAADG